MVQPIHRLVYSLHWRVEITFDETTMEWNQYAFIAKIIVVLRYCIKLFCWLFNIDMLNWMMIEYSYVLFVWCFTKNKIHWWTHKESMNGILGDDSALLRLYWAGDNLDECDEFCYESCPWRRIDGSIYWLVSSLARCHVYCTTDALMNARMVWFDCI